jgi:hypothetical protein
MKGIALGIAFLCHAVVSGGGRSSSDSVWTDVPMTVALDSATASCRGCQSQLELLPTNDVLLHCSNGQLGATIAVSGSQGTGDGQCVDDSKIGDHPCIRSGGCGWKASVEVIYAQNSCFGGANLPWIEGPGIPGRNPLPNSWSAPDALTQSASCSLASDQTSLGTSYRIYDAQTGGNQIGSWGFKVKCPQCKKQ